MAKTAIADNTPIGLQPDLIEAWRGMDMRPGALWPVDDMQAFLAVDRAFRALSTNDKAGFLRAHGLKPDEDRMAPQ